MGWAVAEVDGFVTAKQTAHGGADSRIHLDVPPESGLRSRALAVLGGQHATIRDVRALRGVLDSEAAAMAGLIIMEPRGSARTRNCKPFLAQAGDLTISGIHYPRRQLLPVPEILDAWRCKTPGAVGREERAPALPGVLGLLK